MIGLKTKFYSIKEPERKLNRDEKLIDVKTESALLKNISILVLFICSLILSLHFPLNHQNGIYPIKLLTILGIAFVFSISRQIILERIFIGILLSSFLMPAYLQPGQVLNIVNSLILQIILLFVWYVLFVKMKPKKTNLMLIALIVPLLIPLIMFVQLAPLLNGIYSVDYIAGTTKITNLIMAILFFYIGLISNFNKSIYGVFALTFVLSLIISK